MLLPLTVFAGALRLGYFPRVNGTIKRGFAVSIGRLFRVTPDLEPARDRLRALLGADVALPLKDARVVVVKAARRAQLFSGNRLIKEYPIVLGEHPQGQKIKYQDGRTPEGQYHISTCLYRSSFHIFLGLNYPNAQDAAAALTRGLITPADAATLGAAERARRQPTWKTPLGGAIGLHGGGVDSDWTAGCIAFTDADIEELCLATGYWTPVEVRP